MPQPHLDNHTKPIRRLLSRLWRSNKPTSPGASAASPTNSLRQTIGRLFSVPTPYVVSLKLLHCGSRLRNPKKGLPNQYPYRPTSSTNRKHRPVLCANSSHARSHKCFAERKYQLPRAPAIPDPRRWKRVEVAALRDRRRMVRTRRQAEDPAWRERWKLRQAVLETRRANGGAIAWTDDAEDVTWSILRQKRHETLLERQAEDGEWRSEHRKVRQALATEFVPTEWRAILIVTDNCTRQCHELPLFASGGRVSAEEVVKAFKRILPQDVEFVVSDQGTHVMAKAFQQLATRTQFVHVPVARHRPESNGIAERCVRTLKEWLQDKIWSSDAELGVLLEAFRLHYNERSHQGLGIPGLSPNEFAQHIWLL